MVTEIIKDSSNPVVRKLPGKHGDMDVQLVPSGLRFRSFVPSENFPAEAGRYVLYVYPGCPWAQRATIARAFKGLDDVVQLVELDSMDPVKGWCFSDERPEGDPIYGVKYLRDLYLKADPAYTGRILIPTLWDTKLETIVNNDSSDIIRILFMGFDDLLPEDQREINKGETGLVPFHLRYQIDEMNQWVYDSINNGVYRAGFARTQQGYEKAVFSVFEGLDRLEAHLSKPGNQPYLFGEHITEADIRLFPTLVRFDPAYHTLFRCNLKMIRYDYPRLHEWLRRLYWDERNNSAFKKTTDFDSIKRGYSFITGRGHLIPVGPVPDILPL